MSQRSIYFSDQCDQCALSLGGYEKIDHTLDAVWDALVRNPYGFPLVESDWYSARFIVTAPFHGTPALIWTIAIESNGDVVIDHVEVFDGY
jgi:hypothetical protein